jgi:hypothetical protein
MEQHSQTDVTSQSRYFLEGQLRECYGRVVYSHKTHEKCADILLERLGAIKLCQIILSAVTTAGFIGAVFGDSSCSAIVGIFVSIALLTLNAYAKSYDLGELAQKHKQAASDLWKVREEYLSLLVDLAIGEEPIEQLLRRRDSLVDRLHNVYSGAPSTTYDAYKKAQIALQNLGEMTFGDDEIDSFLPKELKRGTKHNG